MECATLLYVQVAPLTVALVLVILIALAEGIAALVLWRREHEIANERRDVAVERLHVIRLVDEFSTRVQAFGAMRPEDLCDIALLRAEVRELGVRVRWIERGTGGRGGTGGTGGTGGGTGGAGGAGGSAGTPGEPGQSADREPAAGGGRE